MSTENCEYLPSHDTTNVETQGKINLVLERGFIIVRNEHLCLLIKQPWRLGDIVPVLGVISSSGSVLVDNTLGSQVGPFPNTREAAFVEMTARILPVGVVRVS